jgi:hypothetical protein
MRLSRDLKVKGHIEPLRSIYKGYIDLRGFVEPK